MLATLIDAPFDDKDWVFETKWDGFRLVAKTERKSGALYSRNGNDVTRRYASVAEALDVIKRNAVIDGELVALDAEGRSRFQLLQNALKGKARLRYYVFDLLFLDGRDLRSKPLRERKDRLRAILRRHPLVRYSVHRKRAGRAAFNKARRAGEEGIIAKQAASLYHSGKRSREWLKIKAGHEQEAIIVGFTKPHGSREHFGSLVLGVYDKGKLVYVGHSGGGFSREMLATLHARMMKLRTDKKPFTDVAHEDKTTWIRPRLVCQVKFTEWTHEGEMRHPVFLGMRTDKPARQVRRERA
ncbi:MULTISPECIES: non-homologous end-joining DNA ligase [unclassified Bradyrhizobium]|uniref:non-homologous end-joining DNA ligase n=1 Tax=unclassified Bradyrhizobium TaxID=2631580 RepID=UPI00247AC908|nr:MULTISPECIES: non-homologous end-joining DNA ligase [unclassified Bradyrhizobium]WGS21779.1 non-homologous end-joining DNA ligase [Bradyrhizobium sp. ISRA463]WGS28729.1 non-homologous end-joining DNA ligase [Bradyrhizobium sp. ISRA464]